MSTFAEEMKNIIWSFLFNVFTRIVPLTMAYVTRYIYGTDKLRPNGFEVYGLNGVKSGIIFCDTPAVLSQWLKCISDNIAALLQLEVSRV